MVSQQTICTVLRLLYSICIYTFRRRFVYVPFRLHIHWSISSPKVFVYICVCPDTAAQMYFRSMNSTSMQPDQSLHWAWCIHVSQSCTCSAHPPQLDQCLRHVRGQGFFLCTSGADYGPLSQYKIPYFFPI